MSDRFLGSSSFVARKPYLSMNSTTFSHKMKEAKKASSFKLTTEDSSLALSQNSLALLSSSQAW